MTEEEIKKCLNCKCDVNDRMFLYDSSLFCSGQCKDAYIRRKGK